MKGQYFVVVEVLLFAIGVAITSFILVNFTNIEDSIGRLSMNDQMRSVSDVILNGITQVSSAPADASLVVKIPEKLSDRPYLIQASPSGEEIQIIDVTDRANTLNLKIFNIPEEYSLEVNSISSGSSHVRISKLTDDSGRTKITLTVK